MLKRFIYSAGALTATALLTIPASATVPNLNLLLSTQASQTGQNLLPPAACGECFARVMVPAQYKTEQVRVQVKAASERIVVTEPEFTYEEVTFEISPEYKELSAVQGRYGTVTKEIVEMPAHKAWKQGKSPLQTVDHATGEIVCKVEVPETLQRYREKVVVRPPAIEERIIPARYKTVRVKKLVKPATTQRVTVPAEFRVLEQRVKVSDARIEWQPILCQTNASRATIRRIQRALAANNHDPGRANGRLDRRTMAALIAFQKEKGLPVGELTMRTLAALGIPSPCASN